MIKRIIALIVAVIGAIATFLPWATVKVSGFGESVAESVSGTEGDGWITLILFVAIAAVAIVSGIKDMKKDMPIWAKAVVTILAVICGIVAIIDLGDVSNTGLGSGVSFLGATISSGAGVGLIMVLIMAVLDAVVVWLPLDKWIKVPAGRTVTAPAVGAQAQAQVAQTPAQPEQTTSAQPEQTVKPEQTSATTMEEKQA